MFCATTQAITRQEHTTRKWNRNANQRKEIKFRFIFHARVLYKETDGREKELTMKYGGMFYVCVCCVAVVVFVIIIFFFVVVVVYYYYRLEEGWRHNCENESKRIRSKCFDMVQVKQRFLCLEEKCITTMLYSVLYMKSVFSTAWLHGVTCDLCIAIAIWLFFFFAVCVYDYWGYVGSSRAKAALAAHTTCVHQREREWKSCVLKPWVVFSLSSFHDPLSFAISTVLSADCVPSVLLCVRSICCVFCKRLHWNRFSREFVFFSFHLFVLYFFFIREWQC